MLYIWWAWLILAVFYYSNILSEYVFATVKLFKYMYNGNVVLYIYSSHLIGLVNWSSLGMVYEQLHGREVIIFVRHEESLLQPSSFFFNEVV